MKQFSKKTDLTLLILSLVVGVIGCAIIAKSGTLLYLIQDFLETKVFHRTFKIEKWGDTINALMTFPIFFVVFFDTILFVKFSNRTKTILLGFYFAVTAFFIVFCSILGADAIIESDMSAEILLAKECWLKKTFWPTTWHYSTEFRLLNTQLFAAPLFAFTSSWHIVKIVSSFFLCTMLPLSLWFVLNQLKIKSPWVKAISCLLIFCPWSFLSWYDMHFGNFYIPHVAMSFFYTGLSLALSYNQNTEKKEKAFKIIFYVLAFICGLSSIRYVLQFQFPLAIVVLSIALSNFVKEKKPFNPKEFFIKDKTVFYPVAGLVAGGIGYIMNTLVLSRIYIFAEFNTEKFGTFNETTIMQWFGDILGIFGYKNNVGIMTPSGIINVFVYVLLAFFILCTISILRKKDFSNQRSVFILYATVMFLFNSFIFVNVSYNARYILTIVICLMPCFAIFAEAQEISIIKRTVLSLVTVIALLSSSFVTYSTVLSAKGNEDLKKVIKFLEAENYTFGYAESVNANTLSFLCDGRIEMLRYDYPTRKWLMTKRFYQDDYKSDEKVFLLLSKKNVKSFPEVFECEKATKIYEDDAFTVLNFETNRIFRSELGKDHLERISIRGSDEPDQ